MNFKYSLAIRQLVLEEIIVFTNSSFFFCAYSMCSVDYHMHSGKLMHVAFLAVSMQIKKRYIRILYLFILYKTVMESTLIVYFLFLSKGGLGL